MVSLAVPSLMVLRGCLKKADDSPGVIDYAITSPNSLDRVKSLQIITVPPDLSDHNLLAINIELPHCDAQPAPSAQHFSSERLRCLKLPHSPEQWNEINEELSNSAEWGTLIDDLERHIHSPVPNRDQAQTFVDDIVSRFVNLLYAVFGRHHLTKKRCFDNARRLPKGAVNVAPPHLRRLRTQAAQAHRQYLAAVKCNASISVIARAKRVWNAMSSRCRKAARATRRGFCDNWECMWGRMRRQEPRQLWKTFRSFTVAESEPFNVHQMLNGSTGLGKAMCKSQSGATNSHGPRNSGWPAYVTRHPRTRQ